MIMIAGLFLMASCSKDDKAKPERPKSGSFARADINFITDNKKVSFSAVDAGALAAIDKEGTLVMILRDAKSPMAFFFALQNIKVGTFSHEAKTLVGGGIFYTDTSKSNIRQLYLIGEDNIDDNGEAIDGKMTITVSSITKDHIKGTFSTTMVLNSTIIENGTVLEGEIKKATVTNGTFDCSLVEVDAID